MAHSLHYFIFSRCQRHTFTALIACLPDAGDGLDCRVVDRLVARLRYLEKTMPENTTVMVNITRTESLDLTRPRLDAIGAWLTEHMGLSKVSGLYSLQIHLILM